jgi:tetratricopeptide (TPR) repeat protein
MYENGERVLENISDLRRIADLLAIDPMELGLAARTSVLDVPEINATVEQVVALIEQARLLEARTIIETVLRDLKKQEERSDPPFLHALASVHHLAGQVQAMTRKTREVARMVHHYQEMEGIARKLEDPALLALALACHGDLLRRRGEVARALDYLEQARATCPLSSLEIRGTIALLVGRVHLANGESSLFADEMDEALELARTRTEETALALVQFSVGTVYAERARGYGLQGKLEQSQHYAQLAERHLPASNLWHVTLKAINAEALIHAGEIAVAMPLLIEVAHLAQMYGHQPLIERLYRLHYYLEDQISLLRKASRSLSEVLHGPLEP